MNLAERAPYFAAEEKAIEYVESLIWPDGTVCPHCGGMEKAYRIKPRKEGTKTRPGLWKCGHCRKQFTVKIGTIFEGSHIAMTKWLLAIYLMCSSKKGISAKQLQRSLGISYKAAWFLCHRVREAMKQEPLRGMLGCGGTIVEADETWIGGKARNNRHRNRKPIKKVPVLTLIEREGQVRAFKIPNTKKTTLQKIMKPVVDRSAVIMTDENPSYGGLDDHFRAHHAVNHSETFVRAMIIHTNFAESYHALLKRSIFGAYHHISEKYLPRYLKEREFHWNLRHATDGERTVEAIKGAKGKRLAYQSPKR